ncbi:MAG: protein kinase [Vicinamibacteria bacterium]|nr:protein kinase [Vicinamibacteria bacterium]
MSSRERVGKYVVRGVLGRGAMGEVLLGEDALVGRLVALKLMQGGDAEAADRFLQEARVIGGFQHPNIVMLYEFGFEAGEPFLAMERVLGLGLDQWMRQPHVLAEELAVAEGIAAALAYAHARGVLHRDIKPSNVHVTPEGQAKLMDFGIARSATAKLTATGTVLGTPMYMAPETLETAEYSERSDLFSLAVLLYEMWSGSNPFTAPSIATTLRNVLVLEPRDLAQVRPDLPPAVAQAVMACLAKAPAARLPHVKALQDALAAARGAPASALAGVAPGETAALALPTPARARSAAPTATVAAPAAWSGPAPARVRNGLGLAFALAVGVAAGVWLLRPTPPAEPEVVPGSNPPASAATPVASPALPAATPEPSASTPPAPQAAPSRLARADGASSPEPRPTPEIQPSPPPATPTPMAQAAPSETPLSAPPVRAVAAATPSPEPEPQAPRVPVLVSISPAAGRRGTSVRLEVAVEAWSEGYKPLILHGRRPAVGLSVSGGQRLEAGHLRLTLSIDADASLGAYTLVLADPGGRFTNGLGFEVTL